ncbi:flagellar basal body L-ring protein FlgH [Leptospirillum ferrooxidans]|uniref:flagellar basal body L-ring protein FlgH n=1 Tax=Leptospirillum ferrooxidans TaxID=180 RepID=UPI001305420F|nr:flagellar basal body L-ring protein FlgH [Leptospirillum ferrooxidans]
MTKTTRPVLVDAAPHPMSPVVTREFFDGQIPDEDGFMDLASDHHALLAGDLLLVSIPPKNKLPGMDQDKVTTLSGFVVRTLPGGRLFIMVRQTIREKRQVLRYVITGWVNETDLGPKNTVSMGQISDLKYRLDTPSPIKESSFEKPKSASRPLPKVSSPPPTKLVKKTTAPEAGAGGGAK